MLCSVCRSRVRVTAVRAHVRAFARASRTRRTTLTPAPAAPAPQLQRNVEAPPLRGIDGSGGFVHESAPLRGRALAPNEEEGGDEDEDEDLEDYGPHVDASELEDAGAFDELQEQVVPVHDEPLSRVALSRLIAAAGTEYAPPARGLQWALLPLGGAGGVMVAVPHPSQEDAGHTAHRPIHPPWTWGAWSSEGQILGLKTSTFVLAPIPPPQGPPTGGSGGGAGEDEALPPHLMGLRALLARARTRAQMEDAAASSTPASPTDDACNAATRVSDDAAVDPQRLPVRLQVRVTHGLLASTLGNLLQHSPRSVARLCVDMQSMRLGPRGATRDLREARPPVILSSWERELGPSTSSSSSSSEGGKGVSRVRSLFGIDVELPCDDVEAPRGVSLHRPAWGVPLEVSRLAARDPQLAAAIKDADLKAARSELTAGGEGVAADGGVGDAPGGGGQGWAQRELAYEAAVTRRAALRGVVTLRSSMTVIVDAGADTVTEVSVVAPADAWEELWDGEGGGGGVGWPSAAELGVGGGSGLRTLLEGVTIL